jgi:dihydroorotase
VSERFDLLVRGGLCVTPSGTARADVGVRDGRIAAVGALGAARAGETLDASSLHVLPGLVDPHVHFREPGLVHKEDLATGSASAVLGGVTSVLEMPNTVPPTTDAEALADKLARAAGRAHCDHAFFVGATAANLHLLEELERRPGCAGIKVFMGSSTGGLLLDGDGPLEEALRRTRRRVAVHAEDEPRLGDRRALREAGRPASHALWRDAETAVRATRRLVALAVRLGRRVHVLHATTAEEMALFADADARAAATVEVTPQHLTLEAPGCYERLGTLAQMNPPIREARHRDALWAAVRGGVVDVLGSDHAPHTLEEKARPYPESPSGMPGVQTLLPVMLGHVHAGRLTLERLAALTSAGPARVFGIAGKGEIAVGRDGDLVLVDLRARRRISREGLATRCGWTPFEGLDVHGWPVATVLRGRVVMRDGALVGPPPGRPLRFETAPDSP